MSTNTKSKYATKRDAGNQMYGPGCCAHDITDAQIRSAKDRARRAGHFERSVTPRYFGLDADVVIR